MIKTIPFTKHQKKKKILENTFNKRNVGHENYKKMLLEIKYQNKVTFHVN